MEKPKGSFRLTMHKALSLHRISTSLKPTTPKKNSNSTNSTAINRSTMDIPADPHPTSDDRRAISAEEMPE
jgi:hypothetical protein